MSSGAEYFTGKAGLEHVRQPEGSELCFAAVVASVSGENIDTAHLALQAAYLSEENGSTAPPFDQRLDISLGDTGKAIVIETIQGYDAEADTTEGVIKNIDKSLKQNKPVALLYKKTADPENESMHWILLTGYSTIQDGDTGEDVLYRVTVMDPLENDMLDCDPLEIVTIIDHSMKASGVFAYAVSLEEEAQAAFTFEDIQWKGGPALRDEQEWQQGLDTVKLLLENGTPSRIINNSTADRMPRDYDVDDVKIEFLPHWGGYYVGGIWLAIPDSAATLTSDIQAVKHIASRKPA